MMRLLSFDSLITPSILKFLFYAGVVISVLVALGIIIAGFKISFGSGLGYIIGGLIVVVFGVIASRVFTEMILIQFMIRDELAWQREHHEKSAAE